MGCAAHLFLFVYKSSSRPWSLQDDACGDVSRCQAETQAWEWPGYLHWGLSALLALNMVTCEHHCQEPRAQSRSENIANNNAKHGLFWSWLCCSFFWSSFQLLCGICLLILAQASSLSSGDSDVRSRKALMFPRITDFKQTNAERNLIPSGLVKSVRNGHRVIKIRRLRPKPTLKASKRESQKMQARKMIELMLFKHLNERINNPVFSSKYPSRNPQHKTYFTSWPLHTESEFECKFKRWQITIIKWA